MSIYSKIIDIQKLGQAWDRVRKNKPAPGVDNVTCEMFEERRREELRQLNLELSEHRYESLPVKLTYLYKGEKSADNCAVQYARQGGAAVAGARIGKDL